MSRPRPRPRPRPSAAPPAPSLASVGMLSIVAASAVIGDATADDAPAAGAPACGALVRGVFVESAPRDRFEFSHDSPAGWTVTGLALDLGGSAGRLVFDTEEGGEGVEVYQPFRSEAGAVRASDVRAPGDGEVRLALAFDGAGDAGAGDDVGAAGAVDGFPAGETFVFSIDVDDRLPDSELGQTRVSGGEIEGGRLSVEFEHEDGVTETLAGYFGADARVELVGTPCPD